MDRSRATNPKVQAMNHVIASCLVLTFGLLSVSQCEAQTRTLPRDEMYAVLKTARNMMESNYASMKTVVGEFRFEEFQTFEQRFEQLEGHGKFFFDSSKDNLYSELYLDIPPVFFNKKMEVISETEVPRHKDFWISVVTPEHWLHIQDNIRIQQIKGFDQVQGIDESAGARVAYRDPKEAIKKYAKMGKTIDPREFFGDGPTRVATLFDLYVNGLDDSQMTPPADTLLSMTEKADGNNKTYELTHKYPNMKNSNVFVFESKNGFNPTTWKYLKDGKLFERKNWTYARTDEMYFPSLYTFEVYNVEGSKAAYSRRIELVKVASNVPIEDSTFSVDRLNLADGERLQDNIKQELVVFNKGKFVQPKDYRFIPISRTDSGRSNVVLFALVAPLVLLLFAFWWHKRANPPQPEVP